MTGFVSQVQTDVGDVKSADATLVGALSNGVPLTTQGTAASAVTPVAKAGLSAGTLLLLAVGAYFIFRKKL